MKKIQSLSKQASKQVEIIGCMDNAIDNTFESANRVYDVDGCSPTINTCGGGGLQPKIVEVQKMTDCKALRMVRTEEGKQLRKEYENGTIHHGFNEHREYEPREDGLCNTLSTVQKDNLVLESKKYSYGRKEDIERLADAVKDGKQHLCKLNKMPDGKLASLDDGEICDIDSPLASTVTARYYKGIGSHKDNMVLQGKAIKIRQATKDGFVDLEIDGVADLSYPDSETRRGRVQDGGKISPTLTTENIPYVVELGNPDFYNFLYEIDGDIYLIRIRKLIPKECWRLMSFSDEDFKKAEQVNSQTQLYKQAGNSIVKVVLMAIMSQLNIDGVTPWNELSVEERIDTIEQSQKTDAESETGRVE